MGNSRGRKALEDGVDRLGLVLPDAAVRRLEEFVQLLLEHAVPLGMIARADGDRLIPRHVLDSLRAAPVLADRGSDLVVDLGSGAGFPGVPLAIALPEARFTLAEPRSKRAAFLELAVERLHIDNAAVHAAPAESLPSDRFDAATARALAAAPAAWKVARRLLKPGGVLIQYAGARDDSPTDLPGADHIEVVRPQTESRSRRSSQSTPLATGGDLVIISAK